MKKYFLLHLTIVFLFTKQITASDAGYLKPQELAINKSKENIQKYMDFEQDYLDFARKSRSSDSDYHYNASEIEHNISDLRKESDFVNSVQVNERTIDSMLKHFLESRLRTLSLRQALFHTRRYLDDGSERMKQKDASQVTMCQFYDQLIVDIYQLTSVEYLSVRTRFLIRMSPTIWPLLKGKTQELPHPDLAIYGKLGNKRSIGRDCDFDLYKTYEDKSINYVVRLMGLGIPRNAEMVIQLTPHEYEKIQIHPDYYDTIRELPYPNWLKVQKLPLQPRVLKDHSRQISSVVIVEKSPIIADLFITTKNKDSLAQKSSSKEDAVVVGASDLLDMGDVNEGEDDDMQDLDNMDHDSASVSSVSVPLTLTTKKVAPLPPRGSRLFHSREQRTFRTTFTNLSGYADILSNLFGDEKQFVPIKYRDFAALWRAIVGTKVSGGKDRGKDTIREDSGTAHKALLDADGKVVTGIFAHNNNMECTRRTLPYLRYAIELLNIPPSQLGLE